MPTILFGQSQISVRGRHKRVAQNRVHRPVFIVRIIGVFLRSHVMTRSRLIALILTLILMTTCVVVAQNKRVLTAADYDRAVKMLGPNLNDLVVGGEAPNAMWMPDGRFWYVR